jgi:hypothetical protein
MVIKMNLLSFGRVVFCILFMLALSAKVVTATDFYVDPVNGSMSNDGAKERPWSTMQAVWEAGKIQTQKYNGANPVPPYIFVIKNSNGPVHAGDTIYLLSGYHGNLVMIGAMNTDYITIKAADGATPTFSHILLLAASKWTFDGVSISSSYASGAKESALFEAPLNSYQGPSSYITLKNSEVFSIPDITGITQQYWRDTATTGVSIIAAPYSIVDNVHIYNVTGGATFNAAAHCQLTNSVIENVMGDGVGVYQADYLKIEYNIIKNMYDPGTEQHTDLVQFSSDGVIANALTGVEVRGNIVLTHEDENQPFIAATQGISGFDGFFKDFVIENNLVMVGMYHGITLAGAINSLIINNTCVIPWASDTYQTSPVRIVNHKNGTPSTGCTVRNNIATGISIEGGVIEDHNISITRSAYNDYFTDPAAFNYHLTTASPAINKGSTSLAPIIDIAKIQRDVTPDIGAYEYQQGVTPPINLNINKIR